MTTEQSKIYENKVLLDQYMMFNFSSDQEMFQFENLGAQSNVTNCFLFPQRVAMLANEANCPDLFAKKEPKTALDVGCAVGRSCFELSKHFDQVVGIDYSVNFVNACNRLLKEKVIDYECTLEGSNTQKCVATLDADVNAERLSFEVGDACNLREDLGQYDLVLASNLVCRLVEPMKFLDRLKTLVKPKGYVILSTPFTWDEQYTPKKNWLGGYVDANGKEMESFDGLTAAIEDTFELKKKLDIPMVIRETRRKFQYTVCLVSIWQKK